MKNNRVVLKEGREKALLNKHPWIFSGAIMDMPDSSPGDIFPVFSSKGQFLAIAYFNLHQSLIGRVLSFENKDINLILKEKLLNAVALRSFIINNAETSCYRLINAEGDGLPGLIVDVYGDTLVIQVSTYGMELLKEKI